MVMLTFVLAIENYLPASFMIMASSGFIIPGGDVNILIGLVKIVTSLQ